MMDAPPTTSTDQHSHPMPKAKRIRSRVGRRIANLFIGGVLLCVLVVWLRDAAAIKSECRHLDELMTPVREHLAKHGELPFSIPIGPDTDPATEAIVLVDPAIIRHAQSSDEPTLIAYAPGYGLILKSNGHASAIYNSKNNSITIEWLTKKDIGPRLDAQRAKVGLPPRE